MPEKKSLNEKKMKYFQVVQFLKFRILKKSKIKIFIYLNFLYFFLFDFCTLFFSKFL